MNTAEDNCAYVYSRCCMAADLIIYLADRLRGESHEGGHPVLQRR